MLENISTQELEEELKRRKKLLKEGKPKLRKFDFSNLVCACNNYIDGINKSFVNGDSCDIDHLEHMIFETAIESIYEYEVWDWIDERGY